VIVWPVLFGIWLLLMIVQAILLHKLMRAQLKFFQAQKVVNDIATRRLADLESWRDAREIKELR
jgi:hypothetical protein